MARCPTCDYPLPGDRERLGARCPRCRDPLYEPPTRVSRPAAEGESACAIHAGRLSVGTCGRCGNYLCEVCRTAWRDQILCVACVDRLLEGPQATPEQARAHTRAAVLSIVLGGSAWVLAIAALVIVAVAVAGGGSGVSPVLALLALGILLSGASAACVGAGQAIAALRTRGHHMILATAGLILDGLYLGVLIGWLSFGVWAS